MALAEVGRRFLEIVFQIERVPQAGDHFVLFAKLLLERR